MSMIQNYVDQIKVPPYVGRIPLKIASSFSGFTADQFKNWTNLFSMMSLHKILPHSHLQCWRYFVLASRILCQVVITDSDIQLADAYLLQFCINVERLYGANTITPNMHLHCHLKQSLEDYGPIHNFWLFSYERYNGILESFPSNNRSLEIQLMKRFFREFHFYVPDNRPKEFESDFIDLFLEPNLQGSLQVTIHGKAVDRVDPRTVQDWTLPAVDHEADISFPVSHIRSTLCDRTKLQLKNVYSILYNTVNSDDIELNTTLRKYSAVTYKGRKYNSRGSNTIVYVTPLPQSLATSGTSQFKPRPVQLQHFISHAFHHNGTVKQHVFAVVSWLKEHPARECVGMPMELWWKDLYDSNLEPFIPL